MPAYPKPLTPSGAKAMMIWAMRTRTEPAIIHLVPLPTWSTSEPNRGAKVPVENRLGAEGKGFNIAMATLDGGRIGVAAQAVGIAQGAIDETIKYTTQRIQFGKKISQFQNTQFTLADMQTRTDAARLLMLKAADAEEKGLPYTVLAAEAKLFAAETASYVTNRAVQLFGGYGYTKDFPVERMMRDAKVTEIYEGTSEVQRMVISGNMLRK